MTIFLECIFSSVPYLLFINWIFYMNCIHDEKIENIRCNLNWNNSEDGADLSDFDANPDDQISPAEHIPAGYDLNWPAWRTLNRLRTGVGRSKDNLKKWGINSPVMANLLDETQQEITALTNKI
ncbi:Uncharacterized protein FWK35_00012287 [Aphis craccivora]|uniref:Uncharacterized protein n=1 Tax=Aphis craccivora TaxID=307492 RepID=A0A6G0YWT7_APHCR|nr:Uncharacterized protein FWK35_00012287 [Aphis craccivora]